MEKIKLNSSDYSRLNEAQNLVDSLNSIVNKYNNDTKNKEKELKDINSQISKKNKSIEKANENTINFTKKLEELESIKSAAKVRVKELEKEREELSFSDSDVQKMETQEISELISSKHSKINRLSSIITKTKESINNNNKELGELKSDLATLEAAKVSAEKSLERTEALIKLVNDTNKTFISEVKYILSNDFFKRINHSPKKEDINEIRNDIKLSFDKLIQSVNDIKDKEPKKKESKPKKAEPKKEETKELDEKVEPERDEISKPDKVANSVESEGESNIEGTDFSILDEWKNELDNNTGADVPNIDELEKETEEKEKPIVPIDEISEEKTPEIEDSKEEDSKEEKVQSTPEIEKKEEKNELKIKKLLKEEKIDTSKMSEKSLEEMEENIDKVKDNLEILKSHMIPLDLLSEQSDILYKMDKADLEDLLSIITTDSDGNGMGFGAEFTYHCLNELATINVDKLIDVYNQEFMNITDKSGIISLLKKTNPELGDFRNTIEANEKILKDFGIENIDEVEKASKNFVELDHPLFEAMINVFDKTDLVNKINNDPTIVEQILEYWENN